MKKIRLTIEIDCVPDRAITDEVLHSDADYLLSQHIAQPFTSCPMTIFISKKIEILEGQ